jgi:hypothetical protein
MSSNVPFAQVTCLDAATSIGNADATIVGLDYRYAGDQTFVASYVGTLASIGALDKVQFQVSPDWKAETAAGAFWVTVDTYTTTAFSGAVNGPWAAVRFIKTGDQVAKVVALVAGRNRSKAAIQG